jgi:probable HAF family extracellular repeat protein
MKKSTPSKITKQINSLLAAGVIGGLGFFTSHAQATPPQYTVTPLENLAGSGLYYVNGINNLGQAVGDCYINNTGWQAVRWDGNTPTILNSPSTYDSQANGINNLGQAVGSSGGQAVRWDGNTRTTLGSYSSQANAINDLGQVVGASRSPTFYGERTAVRWDGNTPTDLGTAWQGGFYSTNHSIATDINDSGQVVGYYGNAMAEQAVRWDGNTPTTLGSLEGTNPSRAYAINASGQAVGFSGWLGVQSQAVRWDGNTIVPLGVGGVANDINDSGQIVGGGQFSFLYSQGTTYDLSLLLVNNLLENGSSVTINDLAAINDLGQIIGSGVVNGERSWFRFDLYTGGPISPPIPEPSTAVLLISVGALLNLRRRRMATL